MPNYLHPLESNYKKARKELEGALTVLEEVSESPLSPLQSLKVSDEMAEVFRDKPVILIQYMNVKIIQVNNRIQKALRLFDKIDMSLYREVVLRSNGTRKTDAKRL
jgi:hypothetical protein